MKITLEVSDIDYGGIVKEYLPLMREKLSEKDGAGMKILSKLAGMPPSVAAGMIEMMPKETKDEIAVMLVNRNRDRIAEKLTKLACEKGIEIKIDGIEAE